MKRFASVAVLVFLALVWGGMVGIGDGVVAWQMYKQHAAAAWPTADGAIIKSDLRTSRGRKGRTNYHADIRYSYSVSGRTYSGDRIAFGGDLPTSSQRSANDWLTRFPVGDSPKVRYNPEDPSECTLTTEVQPGALFMLLFLLPFNAGLIGFAAMTIGAVRRAITRPPAGGLRVIEDGGATLVRISWWSPLYAGLLTLGVASFIAMMVVAIGFNQSLSLAPMAMVLGGVVGLGAAAALLAYTIGPRFDKYILIDLPAGILTVPATGGVKQATTFDLPAVHRIGTRQVRRGKSTLVYLCIDGFHPDGSPKNREWRLSLAQDRCESLAEFLKERIGLVKNS